MPCYFLYKKVFLEKKIRKLFKKKNNFLYIKILTFFKKKLVCHFEEIINLHIKTKFKNFSLIRFQKIDFSKKNFEIFFKKPKMRFLKIFKNFNIIFTYTLLYKNFH